MAATTTVGTCVLDVVKGQQQITGNQEVDLSGRQHRAVIHLRTALANLHIEAVLLVGAVCKRLVKPTVAGLSFPVGAEDHFVVGERRCRAARHERGSGESGGKQNCSYNLFHG